MNCRQPHRIASLVAIAVFGINCKFAQGGEAPQNPNLPAQLRFLAAGIKDARSKLRCAQATLAYHEVLPKQYIQLYGGTRPELGNAKIIIDPTTDRLVQWHLRGDDLAVFVKENTVKSQSNVKYRRFVVTDRKARRLFAHDNSPNPREPRPYYIGSTGEAEKYLRHGIWHQEEKLDPRSYAFFTFPGGEPLDEAILNNKIPPQYGGEVVIENSRCMRVDLPKANGIVLSFWVDLDHGYIIRQREDRVLFQGKLALMRIVKVKKLVEDKEIWLPGFIEKKTYFNTYPMNETIGLPDDEKVPFALAQITISNFKAECDSAPEAFILDWPYATNVYDSVLQKRYVVTIDFGDEPKKPSPPEVKENATAPK